jgi:PAS domain-containing protein
MGVLAVKEFAELLWPIGRGKAPIDASFSAISGHCAIFVMAAPRRSTRSFGVAAAVTMPSQAKRSTSFRDHRDIRKRSDAPGIGAGDQPHLAGTDERLGDGDGIHRDIDDLLTDGIALLRKDGRIVYANEALRALASSGHDFRIDRDAIEFSTPDLRSRFAGALNAVTQIADPRMATSQTDFAVPRDHGLAAYTVSVRP